jgi:omega-6 fatty acid desaturase (delta-12 desaturase)
VGDASYWLTLIIAVPAAGFLARLFVIQHNCRPRRILSPSVGERLAWAPRHRSMTLTPYDHWRRSYAIHHASSGNLERRGIGDMEFPATVSNTRRSGYFPSLACG